MKKLTISVAVLFSLAACGGGSSGGDTSNEVNDDSGVTSVNDMTSGSSENTMNNGSSDTPPVGYCLQEPFSTRTTGTFSGVIVRENADARCEYEVTVELNGDTLTNSVACNQTGTVEYVGTQTIVSDDSTCGNLESTVVTVGWNPSNRSFDQNSFEWVLLGGVQYPIDATMLPDTTEGFIPFANALNSTLPLPATFSFLENDTIIFTEDDTSDTINGSLSKQ